jgi:tetraacyldisaccharide 4'-kinase
MKTPSHWAAPAGLVAYVLAPFGWIYGRMTALRMRQTGQRAAVPVICIGNLTAGGAGKTPVAMTVADMLRRSGETPVILSRGYGGRLAGPVAISPEAHGSADVGDEPLLLAKRHRVIVARDRIAGAAVAVAAGATVIVLDDGLQNPALSKDLAIAVIDGAFGVGNGFCMPAGPLRAPVSDQLRHLDAVLLLGDGAQAADLTAQARGAGKLVLRARLQPDADDIEALRGKPLFGFAGIGRPEKFFATLVEQGLDLRETRAFPDHHSFSAADQTALLTHAERGGLTLVTTEKDAVRLPRSFAEVVRVTVQFDDELVFASALEQAIRKRRSVP